MWRNLHTQSKPISWPSLILNLRENWRSPRQEEGKMKTVTIEMMMTSEIERLTELKMKHSREEFTRDAHAIQILEAKGNEFIGFVDLTLEKNAAKT
jgi:hypothetical protein